MRCQVCDYSSSGMPSVYRETLEGVSGELTHKVRYYPDLKKYLCGDCIEQEKKISRLYKALTTDAEAERKFFDLDEELLDTGLDAETVITLGNFNVPSDSD